MTDNIIELGLTRIPGPTGNEFLDGIEAQILRSLAETIDHGRDEPLHQAVGMAVARTLYLRITRPEDLSTLDHGQYIARAMVVLRRLSDRQRAKLRHPARNRQEMQHLLDGGHL